MPLPIDELWRPFGSPMPTYTMLGSLGASAMSPIDDAGRLSMSDVQVRPPFVVFHRPPVAKPAYIRNGSLMPPSMSSTRPPMTAGPIDRKVKFFKIGSVFGL